MLLTPDLNHPSIIQLSPEYRSGIGCLYHKYLRWSKLIMAASFRWSRGLLQKSALDVYSRGAICIIRLGLALLLLFIWDRMKIIKLLGNERKLEEDASDCTKVDDDGVEFSPEGGDYFPIMGDETKKDKCSIFLLLLIICIVLMLMDRASYTHSCERLLLKAKAEFFEQPTMHVVGPASGLNTPKENQQRFYEHSTKSIGELTEFKSRIMQQEAGLDELKHDLSTE
nr:hypothetical protein [Tanacetum cinerariifolium]